MSWRIKIDQQCIMPRVSVPSKKYALIFNEDNTQFQNEQNHAYFNYIVFFGALINGDSRKIVPRPWRLLVIMYEGWIKELG